MSRRQYRRNGTPIGKYKVYAIALASKNEDRTQVYEIVPHGIETYEDLESLVMLEMIEGRFGAPERLVVTKPGVDLSYQSLYNIDIGGCNLSGANLTGADIRLSNLARSDLRGADLTKAHLDHARLEGSELKDSNFRGAKLNRANITEAKHTGASFLDAYYPFGPVPHGWRLDEYKCLYRR
jgi:hypothetical protein